MISVPLLAFGFASPWLLWGLTLGAIPIVIHLLYKRKFRETPWAAMRFLLEAARKNSRRIRLEQLLLLMVRTLILLLLTLALARPYVETFGTYFQADLPTHRIIVIDASFSMGFRAARFSRFDRAKQIARNIVAEAKQGDALNLVRISDSLPRAIVERPAYQKSQVDAEIEQLELTDEPGDLFAALGKVAELVREAPEIRRKEIYLISDFQRGSFWPDAGGRNAQIRQLLKKLSEQAHLMLIDLGQSRTPNAALTRFVAEEPFVTTGRLVHLQAVVRNFGDTPLSGQTIELHVDGRLRSSGRVDVAAGSQTEVDFTHTFHASGEHNLEVRLENDPLGVDNVRFLSLPVKDELNVLLIDGKPSGRAKDNATHYLQLALSPTLPDRPWQGLIRPRVVKEGELPSIELSRFDCVFLCNVGLFTPREADILQSYVERGGGLVFCLGDQVQADRYNQLLYRDGAGILPAKLGDRMGNAADPPEDLFFTFDAENLDHSIVNDFRGYPGTGLETALTFEYFQTSLPQQTLESRELRVNSQTQGLSSRTLDSGLSTLDSRLARVALRFNSGDPAIVEAPVGRGRSILVTTAVDASWGTWAAFSGSFVPLMNEIVKFAVSGRLNERQLLVGEPLVRTLPVGGFDMPVTVRLPSGRQHSIPIQPTGTSSISFEATRASGVYDVVWGAPLNRRESFAVNVDPAESDLAKVDENLLHAELLPGVDFAYRTTWQDFHHDADAVVAKRGGITRSLLLAALCLVFVEQLMAWNFFYGFLLLYAAVAAGFVRQTLTWSALYGSLLLAAFAAGFAIILSVSRRRSARTSASNVR